MAYKKYIRKNGKLYGPYIYNSKRVDGKVVSEYYGTKEEGSKYTILLFVLAGIVLLATFVFFIASFDKSITGNVVMGLDASYQSGKPLDGVLRFALKEGELLPEGAKIVFENVDNEQEFILSEILNEELVSGSYYVYNQDISGEGWGYGSEGEKITYPEIEFTLQIYSGAEGEKEVNTGGSSSSNEEPSESEVIVVEENITEEVIEEVVEVPIEEVVEETVEEVPVEEVVEEVIEEVVEIPIEEVAEEVVEVPVEEAESSSEEQPAVEESSPSPITGNVVGSAGGFFASLFRMTGMVSLELQNEISGVVSKDNPFVYELNEGETVELVHNSVKLNGEEMSDAIISLNIEEGKVIVSTEYYESEKGYGKEYIGNEGKIISLDLSDLNLYLEEGDLTIKLVYGEDELVSLNTLLEEGTDITNETEIIDVEEQVNETKENETIEAPVEIELNETEITIVENETVEDIFNSSIWEISSFLTEDERKILVEEFEEISLQTTKSEIFKGRIIKGYALGEYSITYSYDSSIIKDILEIQMERDRIKFLKDIANSISKENNLSEKLEDNSSYIF